MILVGYYGALRVSAWVQVISRDSDEAQLALVGKGDKSRDVAKSLLARKGGHGMARTQQLGGPLS